MFGSLKKKLKDAISKVSRSIAKEEPKEEVSGSKEPTEQPEEEVAKEQAVPMPVEEKIEEELEEKIERLKYIEEKIEEKKISPELQEAVAEEKRILKEVEEEEGLLKGITKRITEKRLTETDIEKIMKELQMALLENDVAFGAAERICEGVKDSLVNKSVKRSQVESTIKEALRSSMLAILDQKPISLEIEIEKKAGKPYLILVCGFNGTGKSTTIAKLASRLKKYSPVLAAGDTFRAASIEQLEEHGRRLNARVIKHKYGSDAAAVIFDAVKHAEAAGSRVVLADTAGRSHSNVNLMDELKKIARVNKPDMKILVLDSLTGNDIYEQSRLFDEAVGIDAIIMTKADVYEKGGAALSASYTIKKPVLFLGTGQNYGDLKEFDAEEIVSGLLE